MDINESVFVPAETYVVMYLWYIAMCVFCQVGKYLSWLSIEHYSLGAFFNTRPFYNALIWWNADIFLSVSIWNRNMFNQYAWLIDNSISQYHTHFTKYYRLVSVNPLHIKNVCLTFVVLKHTRRTKQQSNQNLMHLVKTEVANIFGIPLSSDDSWIQTPTYLIHQSAIQKMEASKECNNIS